MFVHMQLEANTPTICLNMIVKNEHKVIRRSLQSVKDVIDTWVIVDTGSTDGTQGIIQEFLKDIPGELHERPWVNFGHNRQEALMLAKNKADYLLFIDADEELIFSQPLNKDDLIADQYFVPIRFFTGQEHNRPIDGKRTLLVKSTLDWEWKGVLHEYIKCHSNGMKTGFLNQVINISLPQGGRSDDPQKAHKDIQVLSESLKKDPHNSRTMFYLAQSYVNAGDYVNAVLAYEKRAQMGGWDEEVFLSLYFAAVFSEQHLHAAFPVVFHKYYQAFQARTSRAEPLFRLAEYFFMKQNNSDLGYLLSKRLLHVVQPQDLLYVETHIYEYGILLLFANCAMNIGKYEEAKWAFEMLLTKQEVPLECQKEAQDKLSFLRSRISRCALESTLFKSFKTF